MRTRCRKIISLAMCFLCTAALTACQESGIFINNDENGNAYTLSDEIKLSSAMLRSINPITSPDNDFYHITKLVYDSLVELDDTLAPQPSLASEWTIDANSRTAEFTLKSGVKFSDGSEMTAKDVVFSFKACKESETSPYKSALSGITKAEASGSNKVKFKFSSANDISAADFVFPIVSASQFSSQKSFLANDETPVIGTGRYMIMSADLKKELVLEANPNYYGTHPSNNITVEISPMESPYTGFVESGELSAVVQTSLDRDEVAGNNGLTVTEFTSNEFEALGFNCTSGPCSDASLRRAISYIVDRDEIKRAAYYNNGTKSDDLYYPGYYGTEIKNTYSPDDEKAKENLERAGYGDTDGDGILEDADGAELKLRLAVSSGNTSRAAAAQMIVTQLLNSGISVSVTEISPESFVSSVSLGNYDMFIGGWKVSENYDLRSFYHSGWSNPARYVNLTVNGYLDSLRSGLDNDKTTETLEKLKDILEEDVPYLCLMYKTYAVVSSADLEGLIAPRFNNYYYACDDWKMRVYQEDDEDENAEAAVNDGISGGNND